MLSPVPMQTCMSVPGAGYSRCYGSGSVSVKSKRNFLEANDVPSLLFAFVIIHAPEAT